MLVDANLLLYAADRTSSHHAPAARWLTDQLGGAQRVGLPWASLTAFVRISTHPRASRQPLDPARAWDHVERWLAPAAAWIPSPGAGYAAILGDLVRRHSVAGNLVPDAALAALAIEHGLEVFSADSDFARFPEVRWTNPLVQR